MILVDTGPLVSAFDRQQVDHEVVASTLSQLQEPAVTTVPVLVEAFHLLGPASRGSAALRELVRRRGLVIRFLDDPLLSRCFELMEKYADHPMDLADASLVAAAEELRTTRILTLGRRDFSTYRARIGKASRAFRVVDPARAI